MIKAPRGIYVPVITTFNEDESFDFDGYEKIINHIIEGGVHGLLIGGTTGEYHVMSVDERKELIKKACEIVDGRVPIMAGVGCFTAKDTIELANYAAECGAKYGLSLPPYYHQTSEEGIRAFFKEIADKSKLGIVIYNYPGATNVELSPELVCELAQHENIVSVKESADFGHLCQVLTLTEDTENFTVFTGEEHFILPTFAVGGHGAFGILINLLPKEMVELYNLAMKGDLNGAREVNAKLRGIYGLMEIEGNPYPGPVKAALDLIGIKGGVVRKPLTQPTQDLKDKMKKELVRLGYKVV